MLNVTLIPIYEDNYCYIIQSDKTIGLVDIGNATPVIDYLEKNNIIPSFLFTTHHHWDHVDGIEDIKRKYSLHHIAAEKDKHRIPSIDESVEDGSIIQFGNESVQVIETHGHTKNHIIFYFMNSKILFSGDTLFSMGCGRLFEGTEEEMFNSFQKIKALPDETTIYCGHEYTLVNGEFSLNLQPQNQDIINRVKEIKTLREKGLPTIPTTLGLERKTNLFVQAETPAIFKKYRDLRNKF